MMNYCLTTTRKQPILIYEEFVLSDRPSICCHSYHPFIVNELPVKLIDGRLTNKCYEKRCRPLGKSSGENNRIEGFNCKSCQGMARLVRKTLAFSK